MKLIVLTLFSIVFVGLAVAYPRWEKKSRTENEDGIWRNRPVSIRRYSSSVPNSPYFYLRSPRYDEDDRFVTVRVPSRRLFRSEVKRQRDSDSDEDDGEDDDAEDDDGDDDIQDEEFDTPTWESLFPREEQGSYGQASRRHSPSQRVSYGEVPQGEVGEYTLAPGSPGGPQFNEEQSEGPQGGLSFRGVRPGRPSTSGRGRSQTVGGFHGYGRSARPVTVRVGGSRPKAHKAAPGGVKKQQEQERWIVNVNNVVSQPKFRSRQYYGNGHSQVESQSVPNEYMYTEAGPVSAASRRWDQKPVGKQLVYRPVSVSRSFRRNLPNNIWGQQKQIKRLDHRDNYSSTEDSEY